VNERYFKLVKDRKRYYWVNVMAAMTAANPEDGTRTVQASDASL
jgi:hypothetical protein